MRQAHTSALIDRASVTWPLQCSGTYIRLAAATASVKQRRFSAAVHSTQQHIPDTSIGRRYVNISKPEWWYLWTANARLL